MDGVACRAGCHSIPEGQVMAAVARKRPVERAPAAPSGPDRYQYHCGHIYMAQTLRLVGALPLKERQAFVRGMTAVIGKWLLKMDDRKATGWPACPVGAAARRTRRV